MKLIQRPFLYILLPVVVLVIALSFYRFIIAADYSVQYEGECDPAAQSCFVGCEDEECTEEYYYSIVEKHAIDLRNQCGPDITGCELAQTCLPDEVGCTVTYCDASLLAEGESCAVAEEEAEDGTDAADEEGHEPSEDDVSVEADTENAL